MRVRASAAALTPLCSYLQKLPDTARPDLAEPPRVPVVRYVNAESANSRLRIGVDISYNKGSGAAGTRRVRPPGLNGPDAPNQRLPAIGYTRTSQC